MNENASARLVFPPGFDHLCAMEAESKGYFGAAHVEDELGNRYGVFFVQPVRMMQELRDTSDKLGQRYFAEPGLIVLEELTVVEMTKAVEALWKEGYFNHLRPE